MHEAQQMNAKMIFAVQAARLIWQMMDVTNEQSRVVDVILMAGGF